MPIYKYECENGHIYEEIRRMEHQKENRDCPTCDSPSENRVALPAQRSPSPAGEVVSIDGQSYVLDSADDRKRILRQNGKEDMGTHKESWGKDVADCVNANCARLAEGKRTGKYTKLDALPDRKKEQQAKDMGDLVKSGTQSAMKEMAEKRVATSNIY